MELVDFARTPGGVAAAFGLAGLVSLLVMFLGHRIEERRKVAQSVATKLAQIGWHHLPDVLNAYSRGDYSGMFRDLKTLHKVLDAKETRVPLLKEAGKNILKDLYQDPLYRTEIDDFVQQLRDAHMPDKASAFASAIDEVAEQKSLLEEMRTKLQAVHGKLSGVVGDVVPVVGTVGKVAALASNPVTAPAAALEAARAVIG